MWIKRESALLLMLTLILFAAGQALRLPVAVGQATQEKAAWDVTLMPNVQARSELEIENRCKRTHSFQVTKEGLNFLEFSGEPRVTVPGRKSKTLPVRFNTSGMNSGEYQGNVIVKCLTCPSEPTCTQDREVLPVHLIVLPTSTGPAKSTPAAIAPTATPTTTEKRPCQESTQECEELRQRAERAESEAAAARAAADRAAENQPYDNAEADRLEQEAAKDRAYAEEVRKRAKAWRELAEAAAADEAKNLKRASEYPPGHRYRKEWEEEAARDRARATERNAEADKLEAEAREVDRKAAEKTGRAAALRGRGDTARAEAEAKSKAAAELRAAYEECLRRLKEECERQRSTTPVSATGVPGSASGTTSGPGIAGGTPPSGGGQSMPRDRQRPIGLDGVPIGGREVQSMRTEQARLCQWQTIHLGYDAILEEVYIRSVQENAGKNTNVEIEKIPRSTTGPAIRYHCTVENGSAVVTYTYSVGQDRKVGRLLVACSP